MGIGRYTLLALLALIVAGVVACIEPQNPVPSTGAPDVATAPEQAPSPERLSGKEIDEAGVPESVPRPPSASLSINGDSGSAPLLVEFNSTSQGTITSVEWDFGDGTTSTSPSSTHLYTLAGSYTVQFTASGPGGTDTVKMLDLVRVSPGPPFNLEVSPSNTTLVVQDTAQFTSVVRDEFGNVVPVMPEWKVVAGGGSIDVNGQFTADKQVGNFTYTVRAYVPADSGKLEAAASVAVEPGPVAEVVLEPSEVTLQIGETQAFTVDVLDEFGNKISDSLVSWESLPLSGEIDANGIFTAGMKAGSFPDAITVDVAKGTSRSSASVDVSIEPNPLSIVKVHPSEAVLDTGNAVQFTASGFDEHGNEIPALAFIWGAAGGAITKDGRFTAGSQPGSYELQVSAKSRGSQRSSSASVEVFSWGWWPGDGNPNDAAGSNHGTLENGADFAPGVLGHAFSFDGRNDYVAVEGQRGLSTGFTFSAWVYFDSDDFPNFQSVVNNSQFFIHKYAREDIGYYIAAFLTTSDKRLEPRAQSTTILSEETWYHLASSWDGAWLRIYVDGQLENRSIHEGMLATRATELRLGQGAFGAVSAFPFSGLMDEVRIHTRALSDEEIKAQYEASRETVTQQRGLLVIAP